MMKAKYGRCACNPVEHLCGNERAEKAEAALLNLLIHHDSMCDSLDASDCPAAKEAAALLVQKGKP